MGTRSPTATTRLAGVTSAAAVRPREALGRSAVIGDPSSLAPIRGDLPGVAPPVLYHAPAVAVGHIGRILERARARGDGAAMGGVGVVDVDVEERGHRLALSGVADHDHRVADRDDGWRGLAILSGRAEHVREELHELLRVVSDDPWGDG